MRSHISSKSDTYTERVAVDVPDISVKVNAHYPGRSVAVPCCEPESLASRDELSPLKGGEKQQQKSAESIVGRAMTTEGSNRTITDGDLNFDDEEDAESYD